MTVYQHYSKVQGSRVTISSQTQNSIAPSSHECTLFNLMSFQIARLILQSYEEMISLSAFLKLQYQEVHFAINKS